MFQSYWKGFLKRSEVERIRSPLKCATWNMDCLVCVYAHSCLTLRPCGLQPARLPCCGILQARMLEWVAMISSRLSSRPRDQTRVSCVSCIGIQVLYHEHHLGSPIVNNQFRSVTQSCPTLSDPMDCSPPGSSGHGIFQARVLEWVPSKAQDT